MAFVNKPQPPQPQQPSGEKKPAAPALEAKAKPKPKAKSPSPWPWGRFTRVLVSLAVVFHLTAVFSAPWHIQLRSTVVPMVEPGGVPLDQYGRAVPSDQLNPADYPFQIPVLPRLIHESLRHYANLLYINNGYDFFSPDPSVSHLIRYEVFNDNGEKLAEGQLPHRGEQWPRLFYHRHMMLVEQSAEPGGGARPQGWEYRIADRLMEKHNGEAVRLVLLRHHLLTPQLVLAGERIQSDATYEQLVTIEHRRTRPVEITPGDGP